MHKGAEVIDFICKINAVFAKIIIISNDFRVGIF